MLRNLPELAAPLESLHYSCGEHSVLIGRTFVILLEGNGATCDVQASHDCRAFTVVENLPFCPPLPPAVLGSLPPSSDISG